MSYLLQDDLVVDRKVAISARGGSSSRVIGIDDYGFLGRFESGQRIELCLTVPRHVIVLFQEGGGALGHPPVTIVKKPHGTTEGETATYRLRTTVVIGASGIPTLHRHQRFLRLLRFGQDGRFSVYQAGIVTQGTNFFYLERPQYVGIWCYRDGGEELSIPQLGDWHELPGILKPHLLDLPLPPPDEYRPVPDLDCSRLGEREGVVSWFDPFRGVGIVLTKHGPAFLRWSEVCVPASSSSPRLRIVETGQRVTFEGLQPDESGRHCRFQVKIVHPVVSAETGAERDE